MADTATEKQYAPKQPSYPEPPKPIARRPSRPATAKQPVMPKGMKRPEAEKVMEALRMLAARKGMAGR